MSRWGQGQVSPLFKRRVDVRLLSRTEFAQILGSDPHPPSGRALQPVALAPVAIHNVLADPDLPIQWLQMMMETVFCILHSAG